jgi:hypothetical protein
VVHTFGLDGVEAAVGVAAWSRGGGGLPVAGRRPSSIGLGRSVGCGDVQPHEVSPGPHLLYIACATGAHQPRVAEHPRSGCGQRV